MPERRPWEDGLPSPAGISPARAFSCVGSLRVTSPTGGQTPTPGEPLGASRGTLPAAARRPTPPNRARVVYAEVFLFSGYIPKWRLPRWFVDLTQSVQQTSVLNQRGSLLTTPPYPPLRGGL